MNHKWEEVKCNPQSASSFPTDNWQLPEKESRDEKKKDKTVTRREVNFFFEVTFQSVKIFKILLGRHGNYHKVRYIRHDEVIFTELVCHYDIINRTSNHLYIPFCSYRYYYLSRTFSSGHAPQRTRGALKFCSSQSIARERESQAWHVFWWNQHFVLLLRIKYENGRGKNDPTGLGERNYMYREKRSSLSFMSFLQSRGSLRLQEKEEERGREGEKEGREGRTRGQPVARVLTPHYRSYTHRNLATLSRTVLAHRNARFSLSPTSKYLLHVYMHPVRL